MEDEIKTKSSLLTDYLSSIEEKENLISSLQQNFDSHVAALIQLQAEKKELNESLKQKDTELNNKMILIKTLEEQIAALTVHNETSIAETEKVTLFYYLFICFKFNFIYSLIFCVSFNFFFLFLSTIFFLLKNIYDEKYVFN